MGFRRAANNPAIRTELTARQREILALIAKGQTNGEIARHLGLTLDGVKWHVREILGRLGVESREQAAQRWRNRGREREESLWLPWVAGIGAVVAAAGIAIAVSMSGTGDGVPTQEMAATSQGAETISWLPADSDVMASRVAIDGGPQTLTTPMPLVASDPSDATVILKVTNWLRAAPIELRMAPDSHLVPGPVLELLTVDLGTTVVRKAYACSETPTSLTCSPVPDQVDVWRDELSARVRSPELYAWLEEVGGSDVRLAESDVSSAAWEVLKAGR